MQKNITPDKVTIQNRDSASLLKTGFQTVTETMARQETGNQRGEEKETERPIKNKQKGPTREGGGGVVRGPKI